MSNKTPIKQPEETESAPKPKISFNVKLIIAVLFSLLFARLFLGSYYSTSNNQQNSNDNYLYASNGKISLEIVDTPELRSKGLSGRESISDDQGMLFVFEEVSQSNCFWMKDMNFAIDMVWLDEEKKVVTVTADVSPSTYPQTFCPSEQAKYGLEISSNNAQKIGIVSGSELIW